MPGSESIADLVCLTMVRGVGPHTCRALLARFGNPTGVLDHRETILRLRRPGRTLLIDEAFADFVPREDPLRDPEGPSGPPAGGALADERPSDAGPATSSCCAA